MDIQYLKNEEINFVKWDNCINNAHNGNIYAFSWYLDIVCDYWDAIVKDDYSAVMPVLHKKKGQFHFTYNTIFSPQLGVFSTEIIKEEAVNAFLVKLSSVYNVFSINLNKFNKVKESLFTQKPRVTYEFDLIESYDKIRERYYDDIKSSINRANDNKISIIKNISPNKFLSLVARRDVLTSCRVKKRDINKLRRIIAFVYQHGIGEIYVAYTSYNELCAACLFLKSNRKSNLLFSAITLEGMQMYAMHYLIDYYVKKHAGQNLTFNFENLNIPNKEMFCKGFGAGAYFYMNVSDDKLFLPQKFLFRLLKSTEWF